MLNNLKKLLANEKISIVVQIDLNSDSSCNLAYFSDFVLKQQQPA